MKTRPLRPAGPVAALLIACTCGSAPVEGATSRIPPYRPAPAEAEVEAPATLRARLPGEVLAYLRIPSPWGLLAAPKGDAFDTVLRDGRHVQAAQRIRRGLHERLRSQADGSRLPALLFYHLRSPVETALLAPAPGEPPFPKLLATARMDFEGVDGLALLVEELVARNPGMVVADPPSEDGYAMLATGPVAIHLQYRRGPGTLYAMAGMALTESSFRASLAGLAGVRPHRMHAAEDAIDASHRGLFLWVDAIRVLALAERMLAPQQLARLQGSPLGGLESLALGWGVRNGKGRLTLAANVRDAHLEQYFARPRRLGRLAAAGTPGLVARLVLAGPKELAELEGLMEARGGPQAMVKYREAKRAFEQRTGVGLEDLLGALGPELVGFQDPAGRFVAVRLRDAKAFDQLLKRFVQSTGHPHRTRTVDGRVYHHLVLPGLMDADGGGGLPPWVGALLSGKSHLYWMREDGYLIFAPVPQMLRERAFLGAHTPLQAWLHEHQRQETGTAVLTASTTIEQSPQRLYYAYLQLLALLGDAAGQPVDLFALPTARQLRLPERGTYGLQVNVTDDRMAVELTFENNPLEFMLGQDLTTVAVAGILAAIAVPAYQDYTLRAQVHAGLEQAAPLRAALARYHAEHGRFPPASALAGIELPAPRPPLAGIRVVPESGQIMLTFASPGRLADRHLVLSPLAEGTAVRWRCAGDLEARLLPARCR